MSRAVIAGLLFAIILAGSVYAQFTLPSLPGGGGNSGGNLPPGGGGGIPPENLKEKAPLPPIAKASPPAVEAEVGEPITFNAYASRDPLDRILTYSWDFDLSDGYGEPDAEGVVAVHAYDKAGEYIVTLTADNGVLKGYDFVRVSVGKGPGPLRLRPVANAGPDPRYGVEGEPMVFDASGSYIPEFLNGSGNGTLVSYHWDFETGKIEFPWWNSDEMITTYTFEKPGTYTVLLTVRAGVLIDFDEVTVNIKARQNNPPVINADIPSKGYVGVPVSFDATESYDPDGDNISVSWHFGDDNNTEYQASGFKVNHTYTSPGEYTITVMVRDEGGQEVVEHHTIKILPESEEGAGNIPPRAYAGPDINAVVGSVVVFHGQGVDDDGDIVLYEWDFEGDGVFDFETDIDGNASWEYTEVGRYQVAFRVTDDKGATGMDFLIVNVSSAENVPPLAEAGNNITVGQYGTAYFNGVGMDPDGGRITRYEWDFEGDGTFEYTDPESGSTTHVYTEPGTYRAILRVRDDDLAWGYDSLIVTVYEVTNKPPIAYAGEDMEVVVGTEKTINGTGYDPDGEIVLYEWDLDDDGVYDVASREDGKVDVVFDTVGTHTLTLRVTDNNDTSDVDALVVVVVSHANVPPTAYFTYTISPDGGVVFDAEGSYDPDGKIVFYHWDFDGDNSTDLTSTSSSAAYKGYLPGKNYNVTLRVEDEGGLTDNFTVLLELPLPAAKKEGAAPLWDLKDIIVNMLNEGNRFLRKMGLKHYLIPLPTKIDSQGIRYTSYRLIPVVWVVGGFFLIMLLIGMTVGIRNWRRKKRWPVFKRVPGEPFQERARPVLFTCSACNVKIRTTFPPGQSIKGIKIRCPSCGFIGKPIVTENTLAEAKPVGKAKVSSANSPKKEEKNKEKRKDTALSASV